MKCMNSKTHIKNLFTVPQNLQSLKKVSSAVESNNTAKAYFGKHCVANKSKMLPTLLSCKHVDEQYMLLNLYKNISKLNINKHKLLAPYTNNLITLKNQHPSNEAKELLVRINGCNEKIFGWSIDRLTIDGLCVKNSSYMFFNEHDIKLFTDKIYYINYVSIDNLTFEQNKVSLIVKSKIFDIYFRDFDNSAQTKIENKCKLNSIKYVYYNFDDGLIKPEVTEIRSSSIQTPQSYKHNKDIVKNTDDQELKKGKLKCINTPIISQTHNCNTKFVSNNKPENLFTKDFNSACPIKESDKHNVKSAKNATRETTIKSQKDKRKTMYESPASLITMKNIDNQSEMIKSIQICDNINLTLLENLDNIKSISIESTSKSQDLFMLPWNNKDELIRNKSNNEKFNSKINIDSSSLSIKSQLFKNNKNSKNHSIINDKAKINNGFFESSDTRHLSPRVYKSQSLSFDLESDKAKIKMNDVKIRKKGCSKSKQLVSISISRKKCHKYENEIKKILDLKRQMFDELKNIYLSEEEKRLKVIIGGFRKERRKLKCVYIK